MNRRDRVALAGEWTFTLALCFLLLWGGPWAPLAVSGFPLAHAHCMGLHAGMALGCITFAFVRPLGALSRSTAALVCGTAGVSGFAVPAFFERVESDLFSAGIAVFGAILTGFAVSFLLYCCARDLSSAADDRRHRLFLSASALALALFGVLFYGVDSNALLPIACFGLFPLSLFFACLSGKAVPSKQVAADGEASANRAPLGVSGICVFLLGLESVVVMQLGFVVQAHQVGIALAAGAVLLLIWFVLRRPATVVEVYFVVFPLMATSLLAFPFVDTHVRDFLILASNVIVLVVLAIILTGPLGSFCEGRSDAFHPMVLLAAFHISVLAGFGLGVLFRGLFNSDSLWGLAAVFVCLYALSACAFVLLWRRGNRRVAGGVVQKEVVDIVSEQCALARNRFGLSDREVEVLELVMRGRDVPTIAKLLFISPNTVRFHMKNLYQAMGLHGKQEMIDMVESLK